MALSFPQCHPLPRTCSCFLSHRGWWGQEFGPQEGFETVLGNSMTHGIVLSRHLTGTDWIKNSTIPGLCWNSLLSFEIPSRDFLLLCNSRSLIKYYVRFCFWNSLFTEATYAHSRVAWMTVSAGWCNRGHKPSPCGNKTHSKGTEAEISRGHSKRDEATTQRIHHSDNQGHRERNRNTKKQPLINQCSNWKCFWQCEAGLWRPPGWDKASNQHVKVIC